MSNGDNYPDGLANHPDAPWNAKEPDIQEWIVHLSIVVEAESSEAAKDEAYESVPSYLDPDVDYVEEG